MKVFFCGTMALHDTQAITRKRRNEVWDDADNDVVEDDGEEGRGGNS